MIIALELFRIFYYLRHPILLEDNWSAHYFLNKEEELKRFAATSQYFEAETYRLCTTQDTLLEIKQKRMRMVRAHDLACLKDFGKYITADFEKGHPKGLFFASIASAEKYWKLFNKESKFTHLSKSMLCERYAISILSTHLLYKKVKQNISPYLISAQEIEPGDVIVHYKTKNYLSRNPLSAAICATSGSQITHCSLGFHKTASGSSTILTTSAKTKGLALIPVLPDKGEVFLIYRSILSRKQKTILSGILERYKGWIESKDYSKIKFSELKCWAACMVGVVYILRVRFFKKDFAISNIFKKSEGFFCSELVDNIYKEIGIHLVPRSYYQSAVGPAEFIYSPHLQFCGIVSCSESDTKAFVEESLS